MLNPSFKFRVDSKIFVRDDVNIYKRFRNKLRTQLGTRLQTLDFNDVQNATETINDWVFNKTEGKTGKLFSPGSLYFPFFERFDCLRHVYVNEWQFSIDSIDNKTMLLLANVVYFKGSWENQFFRRRTNVATFNISSTQSTNVSMMVTTEDFPYGYLEQFDSKIVVLPYNVSQSLGLAKILCNSLWFLRTINVNNAGRAVQHARVHSKWHWWTW